MFNIKPTICRLFTADQEELTVDGNMLKNLRELGLKNKQIIILRTGERDFQPGKRIEIDEFEEKNNNYLSQKGLQKATVFVSCWLINTEYDFQSFDVVMDVKSGFLWKMGGFVKNWKVISICYPFNL